MFCHLTLKMTTAQVVEMPVTNNSLSEDYSHPADHTKRTTGTPSFKPSTMILYGERFEPRGISYLFGVIVQVSVVFRKTVVGD